MKMHYLETKSLNPYFNLAFEEYVLENRRDGEYLLLWQNDNTVVIGQNQIAEAEINRSFVEEHHIKIVRRSTGGGAVYHDLGNLNYSFITDAGNAEQRTMERFTRPIVKALHGLGLDAEASGRNDILVEGHKVSGTAQRIYHGRILHHGTLLFDTDPVMVSGALNARPEKFLSKSAKSVRSRIGNIRDYLREDMELPAFWNYLKETLAGRVMVTDTLSEEELAAVNWIKACKYDTWEWNIAKAPQYSVTNMEYLEHMTNTRFWKGGALEVRVGVVQGKIADIGFYGDFMAVDSLEPLTRALTGCPYRILDVSAIMEQFPISDYFGTLNREEILRTMFNLT